MKKTRKGQLIFLSVNVFLLLAIFLGLFIYDNYIREPLIVYRRPLIPMEKQSSLSGPLFENFDRMDLFSQYKGTRAVGSTNPGKMVLLLAHPSYEQNFHFSHLLYEAYKLECGLVIMDLKDIRHFIPIEDESGVILDTAERNNQFIQVMMDYMEQYGFNRFRIAFLGMEPDKCVLSSFPSSLLYAVPNAPSPLSQVMTMDEEAVIISGIFDF